MIRQKRLIFALFGIVLGVVSINACALAQTEHQPEADVQVMILGTIHLTGGGSDEVSPEVKNYLAPEGQEEIKQLLDRLETYAPDKIMLELEPQYEEEFNHRYESYLEGNHELTVNERQQVGMRLAERLGHERLFAIDFDSFLDTRGALAVAEELGQDHLLKERGDLINEIIASDDAEKHLPLIERLIILNSDERRIQRKIFLAIAQMGTPEDMQGALQIQTWWQRNMVMFARTAQHAEPGDKVLIVVGAGHRDILMEFFDDANGFTLVDPVPYLKE